MLKDSSRGLAEARCPRKMAETEQKEPKAVVVDPMAPTWTEKYAKTLDRVWSKLPNFVGSFIATVAVFILGSTIRGISSSFFAQFKCNDHLLFKQLIGF